MGYRNVYWYRDGLKGWKKAGLPTSFNLKFEHDSPPPITAAELYQKMKAGQKLLLVDIRDSGSRKKFGDIDGPTLDYPLYRLHALNYELPKDKLLVFYDIRGKQSPSACRYLLLYYFSPEMITYLKGGIEAWKENGLPMK